jgi:hypothetical protein
MKNDPITAPEPPNLFVFDWTVFEFHTHGERARQQTLLETITKWKKRFIAHAVAYK